LAMGDSYSSGEGDVGKGEGGNRYYALNAQGIVDACHVSPRSYPFLLGSEWGFEDDKMASVACSGALVTRDYTSTLDNYTGQRSWLNNLSDSDRQATIVDALDEFRPGLVPQLEFVKNHKPLVVTVTGGGNDVGFAKIVETCLKSLEDCSYAKGGDLYEVLNDAIDSQYEPIKELIRSIKVASPGVKVFYVGYPSFISESQGSCILDSGIMSNNERAMINGAVTRLNSVIRQATAAEGAMYLDVEDALVGGRMCEGGEYMTGLSDVSVSELLNKSQELFHPNAQGHKMLYESIKSQAPNPYKDYSVTQADVVAIEPNVETYRARIVQNEDVDGGEELVINLAPGDSLGASNIYTTIFSSQVDLGVYRSNLDGSANFTVTVPANLESGIHLLLLNITGSDGQPQRLYQYIDVTSAIAPGDQPDEGTVGDDTGAVDTDAPSGSPIVEPGIGDIDVPVSGGEDQGASENQSNAAEADSEIVVDITTDKIDDKKDGKAKNGGDLGALGAVDSDGAVHEFPLSNAVYLTDAPTDEVKSEVLGASSEVERYSDSDASSFNLGTVSSYAGIDYWKLLGAGILFINIIGWMVIYARKVKRQEQQK
ncbi:MAG: SGNH/GDSL hydrolase family protein, partial [Candidatus Saccharimonas sp.]